MKTAVLLLSGGLDSATTGALARAEGFALLAVSFDYGQRHACELAAAAEVARFLDVAEHRVVRLDPEAFRGSALTDLTIAVPKDRKEDELAGGIPETYVPARNTIFLAYALGIAETAGSTDLFLGVNAVDYSGYPDCRPEFLEAFERVANLATRVGVEDGAPFRVHAPLLRLTKAEIIRRGVELGLDYSITVSCYDPAAGGEACGRCDACLLRRRGFEQAGVPDPTRYAVSPT